MSRTIGHGLRYLLWSKVDDDGTMYGIGNMPTAGQADLVRFGRLYGANTVPTGSNEPQTFTPQGDDIPLTTFRYGADSLANATVSLRVRDLNFEAVAQSTSVVTRGDYAFGIQDPVHLGNQNIAFIAIRQAVGYPSQSAKWESNVIPLTQVTPLSSTSTYREDATYEFNYSAKHATVTPWGEEIDNASYGDTGATVIPSDGPLPIQVFMSLGDATRTEFNFVVDITTVIGVWVNGVLLAPSAYTVDTSTSGAHDITFTTAPADGAKVHILAGVPEGSLV